MVPKSRAQPATRCTKGLRASALGDLITKTAYVSEVGLDGTSRVSMLTQQATFDSIVKVLRTQSPDREHPQLRGYQGCPRLPGRARSRVQYAIGGSATTHRHGGRSNSAATFSVNSSMVRHLEIIELLPIGHVVTETDHPLATVNPGPIEGRDTSTMLSQIDCKKCQLH